MTLLGGGVKLPGILRIAGNLYPPVSFEGLFTTLLSLVDSILMTLWAGGVKLTLRIAGNLNIGLPVSFEGLFLPSLVEPTVSHH